MDNSIVAPLIRLANESTTPKLQVAAIRAIGAVGLPTTCGDLVALLHHANPSIRRAAATATADIARLADGRGIHPDVVRNLAVQLSLETDVHVTLALLDAVEACGDAEGGRAIVERLPTLSAALRERGLEAVAALQRQPGPGPVTVPAARV
jgi:HEAT repeat protein